MNLQDRRDRAIRIMCNLISFYLFLGLTLGAAVLIVYLLYLSGGLTWE